MNLTLSLHLFWCSSPYKNLACSRCLESFYKLNAWTNDWMTHQWMRKTRLLVLTLIHIIFYSSFSLFIFVFYLPFTRSLMKWGSESHSVVSNSLWPHGLYSPWNSLGQKTAVGSLSILQGIFPTQGSNPGLTHFRGILYQLIQKGNPRILLWVAYPFSSEFSWLRNWTGVSCIANGFFTNWAIREAQWDGEGRDYYSFRN